MDIPIRMTMRDWHVIDGTMDNTIDIAVEDGDPGGLVAPGDRIREAGWDQIAGHIQGVPGSGRGWPPPEETVTVALPPGLWEVVLRELSRWNGVSAGSGNDADAVAGNAVHRLVREQLSAVLYRDDPLLAAVAATLARPDWLSRPEQRTPAVCETICEGLSIRWVGIYRVADGTVTNEAWSGPAAPAHPTFPVTQGLTSHAVATRAVAVSNDVTRDPRYLTNQGESGSELIVPVLADGEVIGTLDVESDLIGAFDGPMIATCERVAALLVGLWRP